MGNLWLGLKLQESNVEENFCCVEFGDKILDILIIIYEKYNELILLKLKIEGYYLEQKKMGYILNKYLENIFNGKIVLEFKQNIYVLRICSKGVLLKGNRDSI